MIKDSLCIPSNGNFDRLKHKPITNNSIRLIHDQFHLLHSVQAITRDQFHQAMDKLRSGISEDLPPDIDLKPVDAMIAKCNVLKYLANKAEKGRHLAHVDRLTLLHTLGHLGQAGQFMLHRIFLIF